MGKGWDDSWRKFDPSSVAGYGRKTVAGSPPPGEEPPKKVDRGTRRGAKRCIVVNGAIYEPAVAKSLGLKGEHFQSLKEAKLWLLRLEQAKLGHIRKLRRQVGFSLQTSNPAGLMEHVALYYADFVYEEMDGEGGLSLLEASWRQVVEDCKPTSGGRVTFTEDTYKLKKRWFEAQYGVRIRET